MTTPAYRVRPGIGWVHTDTADGGIVHVAPLPNGPVSVLAGTSAQIWLAAVEGEGPVVDTVAHEVQLPADTVRADVEAFVAELVTLRFLVRA